MAYLNLFPMNKKFIIPLIVMLVASILGCNNKNEVTRKLITKKISYDVTINNQNPEYDWWVNNIPGPGREEFVNWIFESALSGKFPAYDYFNKKLSQGEIESVGTDTLLLSIMQTEPPFEIFDTLTVKHLDRNDIVKVRFLEAWYFNEDKQTLEKEIYAIAPVRLRFDSEGNFLANEPLFYLYFDENLIDIRK